MSGNTFGNIFKITTFGESHGHALGCIIDGCPPNLELSEADIQLELDRRKPGQSDVTTLQIGKVRADSINYKDIENKYFFVIYLN